MEKRTLRVGYLVSCDLIRVADRIPSNRNRSTLVHSLAYDLDLLDFSDQEEEEELVTLLGLDKRDPSQDEQENGVNRAKVYLPKRASQTQLTSYHSKEFIEQLFLPSDDDDDDDDDGQSLNQRKNKKRKHQDDDDDKNEQFGLQDDCPRFKGMTDYVELVAGAAITAAELLVTDQVDVAIVWDGGRHHAKKDRAAGFCYINDAVLAILAARKPRKVKVKLDPSVQASLEPNATVETATQKDTSETAIADRLSDSSLSLPPPVPAPAPAPPSPPTSNSEQTKTVVQRIQRVMYLDLDLHWGDGVEEAFHSNPLVLTLSIHHQAPGFFPPNTNKCSTSSSSVATSSSSINIPLGIGTNDTSFHKILNGAVRNLISKWNPQLFVVQCGVDGLAGDPTNIWNLSTLAYLSAIDLVLSYHLPTLLLGGGGYDNYNTAKCWNSILANCLHRCKDQVPTHHRFWPKYSPDHSLHVASDNRLDTNSPDYFDHIDQMFP